MRKNKLVAVMVSAVLAAAVLCGCGKPAQETVAVETQPVQTEQTVAAVVETQPAAAQLIVEGIEEQGEMMVVNTTFCQVKYPFAFADLIQATAVQNGDVASLEFCVLIAGQEYPIFTLHFGGSDGILLGTLAVADEAEARTVYAELFQADVTALDANASTFYAAQECFNDVVISLGENANFAAAE